MQRSMAVARGHVQSAPVSRSRSGQQETTGTRWSIHYHATVNGTGNGNTMMNDLTDYADLPRAESTIIKSPWHRECFFRRDGSIRVIRVSRETACLGVPFVVDPPRQAIP